MNLKSLESFYWVVVQQSFIKAATRLATTQPAISQRVASLEAELGVRLLERSTRSIKLTEKGRLVYEYAERFLALQSELISKLVEDQSLTGILRLGVAETIVHTWLSTFLERAHSRFPKLSIEFVVDITPSLRRSLLSGDLDMAFLLGPQQDSGLVEVEVCRYELNFLAKPSLTLGHQPLGNSDIISYPLITFPKRTYPYDFLRQELTTAEHGIPRILTSWSLSTIVRMAEGGFGICVAPREALTNEIRQGRLMVLDTRLRLRDLVFAVAHARGNREPMMQTLATIASEAAKASMMAV